MTVLLQLENVSVQRGELVLCAEVSFVVKAGEIVHLVGENGLGKTTLLMQLTNLLPTISGKISRTNKPMLYVSHSLALHESLTVAQNLRFLLSLYDKRVCDDKLSQALAQVGLSGYEDVLVAQLSAGQGRRVGLARLWLLTADVAPLWILDEPLTALDVAMVNKLCERFLSFVADGGAILLTSHQSLPIATKTINLADFVF